MRRRALAAAFLAWLAAGAAARDPSGPYRVGPVDAVVEWGSCRGALVLRTADGARFEIEAVNGLAWGRRIRAGGIVHPTRSICRRYPWLRVDVLDRAPPATAIDLDPSIPRRLAAAGAAATARAEEGLPADPTRWLELEFSGPLVRLRSLLRALAEANRHWPGRMALDAELTPQRPALPTDDVEAGRR